ncbi:hypothetical protein [Streptantibioticus silvisoli]|uniref:Esterase n=1 Tax=Streptantibioticus silvisoli TaxID=2705255 RepID=A0ABT6VY36_9ACTN|nr:hypothetical protein [Streptantibioticus silvisoli]MDI5962944.1 hypothetical protein [Streptantibioticus silvisoli]
MSTSSVVLSVIPLAVSSAVAVPLARGATARWRGQRAGRAYELPEDYRPALLRAAASAAVLVTGLVLTVTLSSEMGHSPSVIVAKGAPAPPPGRPRSDSRPRPRPDNRPHPRPRPHPSATPGGPPRTVAEPAGGTLQRFADGTRVWLPPQYTYPSAIHRTFPLVVAYLPDVAPNSEQLFPAFARHVAAGRSDPFVVVLPRDCAADPSDAAALAARYYRTVPGPAARGVLGVGALAPCAIRAALAHPERFGAYVGVAGTYDGGAVPVPSAAPEPFPNLMLAAGGLEGPQRASAVRLRTALLRLGLRARLVDGVLGERPLGGGQRRHELALAAQYFTEELAAPGGRARTPVGAAGRRPPASSSTALPRARLRSPLRPSSAP